MASLVSGVKLQTLCGQRVNNKGLAEVAQVSKGYMSAILNGNRTPSPDVLKKMAVALGVDVPRLERELRKRNAT